METAVAAGCRGGSGRHFAGAVIDLNLITAANVPSCASSKNGLIGRLRAALWSEAGGGVIVGIAPAARATPAQEAQNWMQIKGIDAVLQRWAGGWDF